MGYLFVYVLAEEMHQKIFRFKRSYFHLLKAAPVKIESLPRKRRQNSILDDPRPEKFRKMEGYTDLVKNVIVNYCAHTSQDLAFRYIFPRANFQIVKCLS